MICEKILGKIQDAEFAGKKVDYVDFPWDEAFKRLHRKKTRAGVDIGINLDDSVLVRGLNQDDVLAVEGDTVIAVNIETTTPIASVNAKPLTTLVPKKYKITQVKIVVMFESKILVKALSKPELIAVNKFLPAFNSSLVLSKIRIFASTAIPTDNTKPAIPASVRVTGIALNKANNIKPYTINAMSAIKPGNR